MSKTPTNKEDSDPFFKSMATLKKILASPAMAATSPAAQRRLSSSSQQQRRRSSSGSQQPVDNDGAAVLRREVDLERQQRTSLEKALSNLQDARTALQAQLDAAKQQTAQHAAAYTALQTEMEHLQQAHAAELQDAQNATQKAVQAQQQAQQAVDAATSRVASLEVQVQEMQQKVATQDKALKQAEAKNKEEHALHQKNTITLLTELKKVRACVG